jgi:sterol desaturase/sphingolipid hydroxylase (fatty acid hydroxylase superfamily)
MTAKKAFYLSSLAILPLAYLFFYAVAVLPQGHTVTEWLPRWDRVLLILLVIGLERIYSYKYAVSQRAVLTRDLISTFVNLWVTGFVTVLVLLPLFQYLPQHFLGRKLVFATPDQLGPLWLQIVVILLFVSFVRYWVHRAQHESNFLWEFHSYHHRTTDLKALNAEVSHPIDYALRNVVVFVVLGLIGFDPLAILLAVPVTRVSNFSHCGADIKGGVLNYVIVTPEVHRWHHSVEIPQGHKHSCNYGVEFIFWDILFGTFHLPQENGEPLQPLRIGHPGGLPDEGNYLRFLLQPLGLYRPVRRLFGMPDEAQPAE